MKNETNSKLTLSEKVAKFKLIARESLRMGLISARLSKVATLEENLASLAKQKTEVEHDVKVETYELSKLDANHPNYEKNKTAKEETVKSLNKELEDLAKQTEDTNKLVTEQKEAITKIESGETKVSLEALNDLVDEMVRKDALNQVSDCGTC